MSLGML